MAGSAESPDCARVQSSVAEEMEQLNSGRRWHVQCTIAGHVALWLLLTRGRNPSAAGLGGHICHLAAVLFVATARCILLQACIKVWAQCDHSTLQILPYAGAGLASLTKPPREPINLSCID